MCDLCKKKQPQNSYPPTSSAFFPSGRLNICYPCIEQSVDGDDLNQVDRLFQHANIAFIPGEWRKYWTREKNGAWRKYFQAYFDLNYTKYDWGEQNTKLMELAENGLVESELEELRPHQIEKLRRDWGEADELSLFRMEKFFNSSLGDYNVETEAQRDMLRKIARLSIMIDEQMIQGEINKDAIAQYERLMTSALKQLETTQQDGISSVSQIVEYIEQNGYQPKFYEGVPKDEIDFLEKDIQEYLRDLVKSEVNLTELYEKKLRSVEEKQTDGGDDDDWSGE